MNVKNNYLRATAFVLSLTVSPCLFAAIELPQVISDSAVLQRDHAIPVWGKASANTRVTVTLGKTSQSVDSNSEGEWQVEFPALPAGGPLTLNVSAGQDSAQVQDLYVGDVWVASGQSNMEFPLRSAENGEAELAAADLPQVRHFKVPLTWSATPATKLAGGEWQSATQPYKSEFSAVAYFFAKKIHAETGIPVGLIGSNWGGSSIEAWMSPQALGKTPQQTQQNVETLVAESTKKTAEVKQTLQRWPGALTQDAVPVLIENARDDWSAAQLDTGDWLTLEAPAHWESQGFPGMDGVVWYRKTFSLSDAEATAPVTLSLARIDDNDITWVNGHKVGSTNGYDLPRQYNVPAEYLHAGTNTIAIRVEDASGGGGIYSSPDALYLQTANGKQHSLAGSWKIKADKVALSPIGNMHHTDTALYNKMVHPLHRFPIKGVLWYQGESNADNLEEAKNYAQQFQEMIKDWRQGWQQPAMPFYWVQLANFNSRRDSDAGSPWAIVREAQTAALALPQTGQAITIDVGNPDDIHPRDKKTVGERLALIALNQTYGKKDAHYRGPVFAGVETEKNKLIVRFNSGKGLAVRNNEKTVTGFEIVLDDGTRAVEGKLNGATVVIETPVANQVKAVRYAWKDNPENANLLDTAGLPAEPFRANVK